MANAKTDGLGYGHCDYLHFGGYGNQQPTKELFLSSDRQSTIYAPHPLSQHATSDHNNYKRTFNCTLLLIPVIPTIDLVDFV